jgi:predicted porin
VGYQYNLSKRTALYSTVSLIDNGGLANFKIASNAVTGVPNGRSGGFDVGMKHSF